MSVPKKVLLDILLPNGCVIVVECEEDMTLEKIKQNTLSCIKRLTPFNELVHDQKNYYLESVTSGAQVIPLYDEQVKLNELNLFYGYISLREHDAFLNEKDDLALMSLLLGFPLDDFASSLEREACEARSLLNRLADMLVIESQKDLKRNGIQEHGSSHENDENQTNLMKSQNLLKQFRLTSDIRPVFVQVQERHSTSPICFNLSSSLYSSPTDVVANVISSKLSADNPTMANEDRMKIIKEYKSRYWLQAFGCEERLFGSKSIIQSKYVQTCLRLDKPLYFKLINIESTVGNGKKRCLAMIQEAIKQEEERKKPQKFGGRSNEIRQVWNEKNIANETFTLRILSGQLIPAGEFDEVKIIIGLYHGTQPLYSGSILESRSVDTLNPDWQQDIKFDITLVNLPPASKLCCSIHFHRRRTSLLISDEWICIGWANLNVFNHNSCLIQGRQKVRFWPTETNIGKITASHYGFNERTLAGINPDRSYPTIELGFPSYKYQIATLSPRNGLAMQAQTRHEQLLRSCAFQDDLEDNVVQSDFYDWLRAIDFELTEQSRVELWDRRYECMHVPEALPRWLKCVKWSNREDVLEAYKIVENWPTKNIDPLMTALELLDADYPDPFVRFSAVRLLDTRIDDDRLLPVILQIVQAVKNEPYHDSALARFLLKRSLLNQQVGHFFYWHSRAELKNPQYKVRFGLLLEAYVRYCGEYAEDLGRQVRTVDKLTFIAETIQNSTHDELHNQKGYLAHLLTREGYTQNLQYFRSPVDYNIELGQLDLEHCRIMSSARRPLWLRWTNGSEYAEHYFPTFDLIFKYGDDLRQDMLALQFIQMIDIIWKADGLDLSLLPYGCLATGYCSGLIEVVKNAKTIMNIQKLGGFRGQFQIDPAALYRWIEKNNPGAEKLKSAVDLFTRSCAGYCVLTYVLGVADRHPDNIMVNERGQLFHIDFGHILGNFKMKYGIRRERTQLVLIEDFVRVINYNVEKNQTETREFQNFQRLCVKGYRILRRQYRQIVCLFKLMMNCDLTELNSENDMAYLRQTFDLGSNEQEACKRFELVLLDSYRSSLKTRLDWFFHAVNHIKS
ncbi:hypothetical protein I4U23_002134 [Adineta vaga]|nr:hypothetical protein I4U23_002134 [Adineta vaga]